ncbi:Hypothetical protein AJAP_07405 [Amycolatopsis japonica]|uniref:DUF7192 domain-containing protein n=1 Tax=Amycolatopsis japonica TaxID=208439 RepID=A0A075UPE5_9PSEU|nr:hypothetical protein [Amycolatopsis japonica]AIG74394.1 Hypothetical protein AJAP_07405 [Amycolatopsis japonica]
MAEFSQRNMHFYDRLLRKEWHGVDTHAEARKLAAEGWIAEAELAMEVASEAVELVRRKHKLTGFRPVWEVSGCEIDVARYLAGEPENMIDYEIVPTSRSGRVIVLCASVAYSTAVSPETIKKRGHGIAALTFALSALGFATELWADMSFGDAKKGSKLFGRIRVQVKGVNDSLDPALIMFGFSHPAMLRALGLPVMHEMPSRFHRPIDIGGHYGYPVDPDQNLPDGTIYLPCVMAPRDVPEVREILVGNLQQLGILEGGFDLP